MKTQTITLSKAATIAKCCAIVLSIGLIISSAGKIDFHQFFLNLLDWQSM